MDQTRGFWLVVSERPSPLWSLSSLRPPIYKTSARGQTFCELDTLDSPSSPSRMDFLEKFTRVGRPGPKTPRKNESIKHYLSCLWFISGQDNGASYRRRRRRRWGTTSAFQKGLSGSGETSIFSIFHPKNEPSKQAAHGCLVLALPEGHSMNK